MTRMPLDKHSRLFHGSYTHSGSVLRLPQREHEGDKKGELSMQLCDATPKRAECSTSEDEVNPVINEHQVGNG